MDKCDEEGRAPETRADGTLGQGDSDGERVWVETVRTGEGRFALVATCVVTPRGITVTAVSPQYAHVGATAQAIPRPEPGRTATVSILAVPCHRDEIPAHDIAAALATRFGVPCAASTGYHVEGASGDDLKRVLSTNAALISRLEERIAAHLEVVAASSDPQTN